MIIEAAYLLIMPPLKKRGHNCIAHVGPSVTFWYPINYSRTPLPTFLKHGLHIHLG